LKESWANLADLEVNEDEIEPSPYINNAGVHPSRDHVAHINLTRVQNVNQQEDTDIPSADDQGFLLVTTRAKKKADKLKTTRQGNFTTRSKVGTPKPSQ